jgi:nuclear transport factor 2 (NTF2) superfamily protein
MINSATIPDAKQHKRHNILSFHFVRSLIAWEYINLQHLRSECNIADILTKHWGYQSTYGLIRPIFHFGGNTAALYFDDTLEVDRSITPSELEDIITINGGC